MTHFIIGAIFGIASLLLIIYIIAKHEDRINKKYLGEDYVNIVMSKSQNEKFIKYMHEDNDVMQKPKKDIQCNI